MTSVLRTPGQHAAERRMIEARGSIRTAFDGLGLGFSYDEVEQYMEVVRRGAILNDRQFGRVVGAAMALALTCVEQDRALSAETTPNQGSDQ